MKKTDAKQLIGEIKKWFPEESAARLIFGSFEVEEYYGEAFVTPVSFRKITEQKEWNWSKDPQDVSAQIRRAQKKMETEFCPFRSSVYLTHDKGLCVLVLGTEFVKIIRQQKQQGGLQNVTLAFKGRKTKTGELPEFKKNDLVQISASSPVRGWLYLFSIDATGLLSSPYPGEGEESAVLLSQNSRINITDRINDERKKMMSCLPDPLHFVGDIEGTERVVALVVDTQDPLPVTIAHLRSRFPLAVMFAHETHREKGIGYCRVTSENDFSSLSLEKLAIGTLDYYYSA